MLEEGITLKNIDLLFFHVSLLLVGLIGEVEQEEFLKKEKKR